MEKQTFDLTSSLILSDTKINKITPSPEKAHSLPDSEPDSEPGLCWICLDDTKDEPLLSELCFCTNRQVHKSCLEKWYHYSRERQKGVPAICPACKCTYRDIELESLPPENIQTAEEIETEEIVLCDGFWLRSLLFQRHIPLPWQLTILLFGLIYGIVCKTFAHRGNYLEIYIAVAFNFIIGVMWLFASVYRSVPPSTRQTLYSDVFLLGETYVNFLLGCAIAIMAGMAGNPSRNGTVGLVVHAVNFFCCLIFIGARVNC